MSRSAEIRLPFAGEDRLFRLPIGPMRAVQERCDAGPMTLLQRYLDGGWRLDDLREVILQGLKGGGMPDAEATRLVQSNFDGQPLGEFVPIAQAIVMASVIGAPDEDADDERAQPGEAEGARIRPRSRTAKSGSPTSTRKARRSATARASSTT